MRSSHRQKTTVATGAVAALAALGLMAPARAELPAELAGAWQGQLSAGAGDVRLDIEPSGQGFSISWQLPSGREGAAEFAAAALPGVYKPVSGGVFGMFGSSDNEDPLHGGRLLWARTEAARLVVYAMSISDAGGYAIDRLDCAPSDQGVELTFTRRQNGADPEQLRVPLTKAAAP